MELTHTYKHKASKTGFSISPRQSLLSFVNRHANVFEALCRLGAPFGGSLSPARTVMSAPTSTMEQQIALAQQQVDQLTQTVSNLRDQINKIESPRKKTDTVPADKEVGINRFRALRSY